MSLFISRDLDRFALHDGELEGLVFSPEARQLLMDLALTEESNDEIGWYGKMVFHNVTIRQSNFDLAHLDWEKINWTDIASSDYKPEHNTNEQEAVFWAIALYYEDGREDYLILEFLAENFDWFADRSRASRFV